MTLTGFTNAWNVNDGNHIVVTWRESNGKEGWRPMSITDAARLFGEFDRAIRTAIAAATDEANARHRKD